jgi:GNAT superfamily N-acetyltransferase
VNALTPLIELFTSLDRLLEHFEPTWWGSVAADSRLPLIYDANYASVTTDSPVALAEVEASLLPALERAGATHVHVVVIGDERSRKPLLDELEASGGRFTFDTAMRFEAAAPSEPIHPVREMHAPDEGFWDLQRRALPEFDISGAEVIDLLIRWQREVLAPGGKRWFTVSLDGRAAGSGSLYLAGRAAYVDDVVTFPEARRRGVASAVVSHMVAEALEAGAGDVYLLADAPGPIRLYERLGFAAVGENVGSLRPRT